MKQPNILTSTRPLGPFPSQRLRQVEKPTNVITDSIQRIDMRNIAYELAARGEYGPVVQKERLSASKYPLSAAQKDVILHISKMTQVPVSVAQAPITDDPGMLTRHIKSVAYFLKADMVGICRPLKSSFYSHDKQGNPIDMHYKNAVVFIMRKDWKAMRASSGKDWIGNPISFQCYEHLGIVAETIANYIKRLGWDARPEYGPSAVKRYDVLIPPLLLWAGLGEVSRAGIILNPFLGLGFKGAAVLTNMPLVPDKPIDFGLQSFCEKCKICAEVCPSKAIPTGKKVMYNGYETWKLDVGKCVSFNIMNPHGSVCNRCVKSCPWSQPPTWPHNLVRRLVSRSEMAQTIAIKGSRILGIGESHYEDQWWFDVKYSGDILELDASSESQGL